jgi:hypothetical protein
MTRIAVSIQTLTDEVHARSPQTTIYHYDNGPRRDSDHDPNSYGVICACDIMEGYGLELHDLSREIVAGRHPEAKYVIFNRQIASRNTGWEWEDYEGESDHTDHIHVSVGVGPDGYSRPPYDSTRPWLKNGPTMYLAACKIGDKGPHVQFMQYGLYDLHADKYGNEPDYKPLYPGNPGSPTLPATFDKRTGDAMKDLLEGGDGVNFTPLLAKRLIRKLGALDAPDPIPGPPGEGVTAVEAKTIAEDVIRHATITPAGG